MSAAKNAIKKAPARLLVENAANWRYAVGVPVSDPALWYASPRGVTHVVVNELELGHLQGHATVDHVHGYAAVKMALAGKPLTVAAMVGYLISLEQEPPAQIVVPGDFPVALFERLKEAGLPLTVAPEPLFFAGRALKTAAEIAKLQAAQRLNETAFDHAFGILRASKVRKSDRVLLWQGSVLTSERLRGEMNAVLVRGGAIEFGGGPIVAAGAQGAVPHERGHGPLKAGEMVVIDCFPRHANGFWGDLTRTVIKGPPTPWQRQLHATVLAAQKLALGLIQPGVNGKDIQAAVQAFFDGAGFTTGQDAKGRACGFFHGVGHGVGLELHDPGPRTISTADCVLQAGMVTSVEPGLYYGAAAEHNGLRGGKAGCRIEDVVVVTATGCKNLTKLSKTDWIL